MFYKKKRTGAVLLFIFVNLFFFAGCLSTQSGGSPRVAITPNLVVETTAIAPSIEVSTITPTNAPTFQTKTPVPFATNTIPAVISRTPTITILATETPAALEPFPLSWIAFEDIGESIDIIQTNGMGRRPIVESVQNPTRPV